MFRKVYIEITNVCNYRCSFCADGKRRKRMMSIEDIERVLGEVRGKSRGVYFHVLGEPMTHPRLNEVIALAAENGLEVYLTTNGSLIMKELPRGIIKQCNISVHSAAENVRREEWESYLDSVFGFAKERTGETLIRLRLWNGGVGEVNEFNVFCLAKVNASFGTNLGVDCLKERMVKISDHIFLQNANRFSWPGQKKLDIEAKKCMGLRDQIAILADGSVVPCCLDAEGSMILGNIFKETLGEIIAKPNTQALRRAIGEGRMVTEACRNCGFIMGE